MPLFLLDSHKVLRRYSYSCLLLFFLRSSLYIPQLLRLPFQANSRDRRHFLENLENRLVLRLVRQLSCTPEQRRDENRLPLAWIIIASRDTSNALDMFGRGSYLASVIGGSAQPRLANHEKEAGRMVGDVCYHCQGQREDKDRKMAALIAADARSFQDIDRHCRLHFHGSIPIPVLTLLPQTCPSLTRQRILLGDRVRECLGMLAPRLPRLRVD